MKILMKMVHQREILQNHLRNSPVSITVLLVRTNVPSARVAGLGGYDLGSLFRGTLNVEVLLVLEVLERPAATGVLNPPLRVEVQDPLLYDEARQKQTF